MVEPEGAPIRYTAFLSYSHKDAAAAGRLHRQLETYRLPRRLVGTETLRGKVPERLWPIFRDREELPAATDLSETVRNALAQSGALIILCSPHSAESLWVAEEIETFRALHPERPILAAILDGDPPECFSAALRASSNDGEWHEPLATDLRPGRDGARLGLLKLVAGIAGIGLDDLVQRDSARRVRRATVLTILVTIAMLAMAALAFFAVRARSDAERQRAEAEDLIQFMLIDLHSGLEGVGRLDVMRPVTERALAHYDLQIRRGDRSTRTQLQRARVLLRLTEEDILQARMALARDHVMEAWQITTALQHDAPNDPERIFAHAQSTYWIGQIHGQEGNLRAAGLFYQAYATAAQRLIAIAPSNPDYMMERAYAASNLGTLLVSRGHPMEARAQFLTAIRWFDAARRARPGNQTPRLRLANAYANFADTYWVQEDWANVLDARRRQVEILTPLRLAYPARLDIFYDYIRGRNGLGHALRHNRRQKESLAMLDETLASAHRLTELDPSNREWLTFLANVQCGLLGSQIPARMTEDQLIAEFQRSKDALQRLGDDTRRFDNCRPPAPSRLRR